MTAPPETPTLPAPRLLRDQEVPLGPDDRVVWQGITGHMVVAGLCLALAWWMWSEYQAGDLRWGYLAGFGGPAALLGIGAVAGAIEVLWRRAWLLVIGPEAVLVRFRARRGDLAPGEPQIVELPIVHIDAAQQVTQTRAKPARHRSGREEHSVVYLDFRVHGMDLGALAEALERERARHGPSLGDRPDPVLVMGDVLRVQVGPTRPGHETVLRLVGARLPMEEDAAEEVWMGGPPVRKPPRERGARK